MNDRSEMKTVKKAMVADGLTFLSLLTPYLYLNINSLQSNPACGIEYNGNR